jgi:DNA-binding GntR family transcriptional regulator
MRYDGKKSPESYRKFAEIHNEFHALIAELAGSELLLRFIKQMNLRSMMLFNAKRIWASKPPAEKYHHEKYVETILNAPLEKALEKVKEHIRAGLVDELSVLNSIAENSAQGVLN